MKFRGFEFGAFAAPLTLQLQDTNVNGGKIAYLQQLADAAVLLHVQRILTEPEYDRALKRITDKISKAIKESQ